MACSSLLQPAARPLRSLTPSPLRPLLARAGAEGRGHGRADGGPARARLQAAATPARALRRVRPAAHGRGLGAQVPHRAHHRRPRPPLRQAVRRARGGVRGAGRGHGPVRRARQPPRAGLRGAGHGAAPGHYGAATYRRLGAQAAARARRRGGGGAGRAARADPRAGGRPAPAGEAALRRLCQGLGPHAPRDAQPVPAGDSPPPRARARPHLRATRVHSRARAHLPTAPSSLFFASGLRCWACSACS